MALEASQASTLKRSSYVEKNEIAAAAPDPNDSSDGVGKAQ